MRKIIYNAIRTPDGTLLESHNRHDYRTYIDSVTNEEYMVDGGNDYLRRNLNKIAADELSVYIDEPHNKVRQFLKWGTRGVEGDQPLKYVSISKMETDHLKAVVELSYVNPLIKKVMMYEIELRDS